jgi:Gas vesicle protein K
MPVKRKTASAPAKAPGRRRPAARRVTRVANVEVEELDSMRAELERMARKAAPPRWNANPEDVRRSVAKLVLTLVEFIRQLLERQAIRRMDAGTLTPQQTEAVGLALMRLEETVREIGAQFGLDPADLSLDLGPVGKLM